MINAGPTDTEIELVPIETVSPSPENDDVYGAIDLQDNDLVNLANDIAKNGVREPIVISSDGYIASGHRRYAASKLAGLKQIPARRLEIVRGELGSVDWKRILCSFNQQRVKSAQVRMKEAMLGLDPETAYRELLEQREEKDRGAPAKMVIRGSMNRAKISKAKMPMLEASISAIYELKDYWPLSVRQIHYGMLNEPPLKHSKKPASTYANDKASYQDLVRLLTRARLEGYVEWDAIRDETRPTSGLRYDIDSATYVDIQTYWFLRRYRRDLMQSQPDHVEVVGEKMTAKSIIETVTEKYCVPTTIGRGYCSLDPRRAIAERYEKSGKDRLVLIVVSDFDPDGEEIANSLATSLRDDFGIDDIMPVKALLTGEQVKQWDLPPNSMEAKKSSPNYKKFLKQHGTKVFELEAIPPAKLQEELAVAIEGVLDIDAFNEELEQEKEDSVRIAAVKKSVVDYLAEIEVQ